MSFKLIDNRNETEENNSLFSLFKENEKIVEKHKIDFEKLKSGTNSISHLMNRNSSLAKFYGEYLNVANSMKGKFHELDDMKNDSTIMNACTYLVDDITQYSPFNKKTIWGISNEDDIQEDIDNFVDEYYDYKFIWAFFFKLAWYGNNMIRLYYKDREKFTGGIDYIEIEKNLFRYIPLKLDNKLIGWIDTYEDKYLQPFEVYHCMASNLSDSRYIDNTYEIESKRKNSYNKVEGEIDSSIEFGTSMFDNTRYIWKQYKLMKANLILTRLDRSQSIRIFKVKVQDITDEADVSAMVDLYSSQLSGDREISLSDDLMISNRFHNMSMNVMLPVTDTQDLLFDEIKGDTEVSGIEDVNLIQEEFHASLTMPKEYLGFGESKFQIGETDLIRQEIRYARTAKKIQFFGIEGLKTILYYHLLSLGRMIDWNDFSVVMNIISTAEDEEFKKSIDNSLDITSKFFQLVDDLKDKISSDGINPYYLIKYVTQNILNVMDIDWNKMFDFDNLIAGETKNKFGNDEEMGDIGGGDEVSFKPKPKETGNPKIDETPTQEYPEQEIETEAPEEGALEEVRPKQFKNVSGVMVRGFESNQKFNLQRYLMENARERKDIFKTIRNFVKSISPSISAMSVWHEGPKVGNDNKGVIVRHNNVPDFPRSKSIRYIESVFRSRHSGSSDKDLFEDVTTTKQKSRGISIGVVDSFKSLLKKTNTFNISVFKDISHISKKIDILDYEIIKTSSVMISFDKLIFTHGEYSVEGVYNADANTDIYVYLIDGVRYITENNAYKLFKNLLISETDIASMKFKQVRLESKTGK